MSPIVRGNFARDEFYRGIGQKPNRPFSVLAITHHFTLGDLVAAATFAATVRDQFDYGQLRLVFRDVHKFSRQILSLVPGIDWSDPLPGDWPAFLLRRFPHLRPWRPFPLDTRRGTKRRVYDLVITDQMASARNLHALPNPVRLRVPQGTVSRLDRRLEEMGLHRSRWYAVIHYREDSYRFRPASEIRRSDPAAFQALCDAVIDRLGGMVVRVGHVGMASLHQRPGIVDLAREPDGFLLQARAIERARFVVAGPSGPIVLAWGMHVPAVLVDATENHGGWGPAPQWILTQTVTLPDGKQLRNQALQESGLLCSSVLPRKLRAGQDYRLTKATAAELIQATQMLASVTTDTPGWREHRDSDRVRPNSIRWPVPQGENMNFLNL